MCYKHNYVLERQGAENRAARKSIYYWYYCKWCGDQLIYLKSLMWKKVVK